jgi:hypothetical protein
MIVKFKSTHALMKTVMMGRLLLSLIYVFKEKISI